MAQERIGRYRLEEVIGVGSFATVYRAADDWLEDTVAVKVLAENHSLNPEVRERFIAEGRSLRRVDNPHVVAVHDIGETDRQQPFLVLEHADRGTLSARVERLRGQGWTATPGDVLIAARALAAAIEAVHGAQLVHRDLSPGNVLLTTAPGDAVDVGTGIAGADAVAEVAAGPVSVVRPGERLVVADLGMCKDLARNSGLTVAAGTSGFRPPEQAVGGVVDTRADIWSLSALLGWLAEGADLPEELGTVLERSRAVDPRDRHPDVASWLADVEQSLAPEPEPEPQPEAGSERGPGTEDPSAPAAPPGDGGTSGLVSSAAATGDLSRSTRQRVGILLAAVAVGILCGVLGLHLLGPSGDRTTAQTDLASVAIDGPTDLTVGEEVTFTAEVTGLDSWVWTLPSGRYVLDLPEITVTPQTTGPSHLVLRGQDGEGREVEITHELRVTD